MGVGTLLRRRMKFNFDLLFVSARFNESCRTFWSCVVLQPLLFVFFVGICANKNETEKMPSSLQPERNRIEARPSRDFKRYMKNNHSMASMKRKLEALNGYLLAEWPQVINLYLFRSMLPNFCSILERNSNSLLFFYIPSVLRTAISDPFSFFRLTPFFFYAFVLSELHRRTIPPL